jgi:uracil-DNA glycosylase
MELILHNISKNWLNIIYSGETKKKLDFIYTQLNSIKNIAPKQKDWFNWCRYTELNNIKVMCLDQEPYNKNDWSHGLSYSCFGGISPSLKNIYNCLIKTNCINKMPTHGDLTSWAKQGVLLLNASLTATIGNDESHMKLWMPYIKIVIERICDYYYNNNTQLIFLLWGSVSQSFIEIIDDDYHICLDYIHPSPLEQKGIINKNFINCEHFNYINKFLETEGLSKINWIPEKTKQIKILFDDAESIFGISADKHIAFTDGSCYPNNKSDKSRSGYASIFVSGPYKDKCVYGNMDIAKCNASNIRAEGFAIIRTLELINDCKDPWNKCDIITDCELWVKMIDNYMPKWSKEKFKEKANPDLTLRLWLIYNEVKKKGEIKLIHMRSHGKDGWQDCEEGSYNKFCFDQNDYVDKLCGYARVNMKPTEELFKPIEYT